MPPSALFDRLAGPDRSVGRRQDDTLATFGCIENFNVNLGQLFNIAKVIKFIFGHE